MQYTIQSLMRQRGFHLAAYNFPTRWACYSPAYRRIVARAWGVNHA